MTNFYNSQTPLLDSSISESLETLLVHFQDDESTGVDYLVALLAQALVDSLPSRQALSLSDTAGLASIFASEIHKRSWQISDDSLVQYIAQCMLSRIEDDRLPYCSSYVRPNFPDLTY